jgi:hypothetical protein
MLQRSIRKSSSSIVISRILRTLRMSGSEKRSRELRDRTLEFRFFRKTAASKGLKEYILASGVGGTFIVSKF